ncbi:MAG TPA: DNA adenine methylase [Kiritimatiellia bacterium]|nr:DNA adenine methylase [Kiritimatiellia bacterium]HRZ13547.1 DNA adenine methylase [Kiritimatiellia bacterium]HSA19148.1 DNA adenine methylase [Kiritimatiellia bacterium]
MKKHLSLFRYPGGKYRLIGSIREKLDPLLRDAHLYVEPFAGGFSVGLSVAQDYPDIEIWLNDLDQDVSAFWHVLASGSDRECQRLLNLIIQAPSVELLEQLRATPPKDQVERAYRAIFFNHCTFSGMANSGPLGGYGQDGKCHIGDRFNCRRIIAECIEARKLLRGRTKVFCQDGIQLIREAPVDAVLFVDPPYVKAGKSVYREYFQTEQHKALAEALRGRTRWVATYDMAPEIKDHYDWAILEELPVNYSIKSFNTGLTRSTEYLITPPAPVPETASEVVYSSSSSSESLDETAHAGKAKRQEEKDLGRDHHPAVSLAKSTVNFADYEYLTTKEAAMYLRRSPSWLLHNKEIPYLTGSPNTYKKSDLDAWFNKTKSGEI